jgi:hypothetical protein
MTWDALRKSINGLVNKVNAANIKHILPEVFSEVGGCWVLGGRLVGAGRWVGARCLGWCCVDGCACGSRASPWLAELCRSIAGTLPHCVPALPAALLPCRT